MSNPLAVAAVTATFAQLLGRVTEEPTLSGASVTTDPPDRAVAAAASRRLNLFLYGVSPSGALRNMDLPVRRHDGKLVEAPTAALELRYLVTAFGQNDDELDGQHLLAYAMSLVNDEPVLTPAAIESAKTAESRIAGSDLADQVQLVRLCPESLSIDDLSKLWAMFQDTHYRLSVAYQASVVLIERRRAVTSAPPVHRSNVYVVPLRVPVIDSVSPVRVPPRGTLVITGRNLGAAFMEVHLAGAAVPTTTATDRRIELSVPHTLKPGMTAVRVLHPMAMGSPPTPHRGFESNVVAFVAVPAITTAMPLSVARGSSLSVDFEPSVTRPQRLSLLIGDRELTVPPEDIGSAPIASMSFPVPGDFPTGTFLVRLRVNDAESLLEVDDNPGSPTFDQFVGPKVKVT